MTYATKGVCSRKIDIDVQDGVIVKVAFLGGCSGNTQGLCALLEGMTVEDAIKRLDGIKCGPRPTSCPDQLANALKEYINK
ncbi:MAG: TIGR03905 family TSCPD domain-containing protein [Clostridia bacterium]|nr:TIGR03905 family TSCPD domain-containing protein [Clostridia bacterium]